MKKLYKIIFISFFLGVNFLSASNTFCEDNSKGKVVFKNQCVVCHLVKSDKTPAPAYNVQNNPPDFTTCSGSKNLSKEKIYFVLRNGQGAMNPVKLNAEDSIALVDYLIEDLKKNCR